MNKIIKLLAATVVASAASSAVAASKIGYVDVQKFIEGTGAGKKAKETLDGEYNKRKKDLDKKRADLEKMSQDLEKKKSVLSDEVFGKKQADLQEEVMKWQKSLQDNNMEMQKKQKELLDPIIDKMRTVVEKIAKEKDYAIVLERQGQNMIYAAKDADLTDDVIKAFDK